MIRTGLSVPDTTPRGINLPEQASPLEWIRKERENADTQASKIVKYDKKQKKKKKGSLRTPLRWT